MPVFTRRTVPIFIILLSFVIYSLLFLFAQKPAYIPALPPNPPTITLQPTESVLGEAATSEFVPVVKVVDGDTITVQIQGKRETIRLIGINTPETVDPRREVECFGREASEKAKATLTNQKVRLQSDPTQADRDRYQRLLRYVFLPDGTHFNRLMIEEGFAYEYTYSTPYRYQREFKEAEQTAKNEEKGLWGGSTCQGKR